VEGAFGSTCLAFVLPIPCTARKGNRRTECFTRLYRGNKDAMLYTAEYGTKFMKFPERNYSSNNASMRVPRFYVPFLHAAEVPACNLKMRLVESSFPFLEGVRIN
jgi:hypothetical protein